MINKRVFIPVDVVLAKYPGLVYKEGKAGGLACKLAHEAFFGEEVMVQGSDQEAFSSILVITP